MSADPVIGTVVAGHRIEAVIGRGGMGTVYRGRHLRLGKSRAIKLLPSHLADDVGFRTRFEREWRAAAEIEHSSIVEVLDAGEQDGRLYIVMRLIEGVDLHTAIQREGVLEAARAVGLLAPVADALDAAHARGLVHRDVKPSNILVAEDGRAYLSDFGVAKSSSTRGVTKTGFFVGTVDYAAPEQIEGKPLDGRTDVYALGGVLYSCVTGAPPYERDTDLQVMYAQLHDPVPAPSAVRPDVPHELDDVVGRGMAKSPGDRYPTCGELLRDAERAVRRAAATTPAPGREIETKLDPALLPELERAPETVRAAPAETESAPPSETELAPRAAREGTGGSRRDRRGVLIGLLATAVLIGATAAAAAILLGGGSDTVDVSGRVVDAASGEPIVGARVEAGAESVETGSDGTFAVADLPHDTTVAISSCAYAPRELPAGEQLTVRLTPRPVRGRVRSGLTGLPLVATVGAGARTARTGRDGRYRLDGVCPGERVEVSAPGFLARTMDVGESRRASVVLAAPKSVRETFSNVRNWFAGAGGSTGGGGESWSAFVTDGAYHVRVTQPEIVSGARAADFDPVTKLKSTGRSQVRPADIRFTVEARKVTGADTSTAAGVSCNTANGLSYEFIVGSDGYYRLDRRARSGDAVELSAWKRSSAIRTGTSTNRVRVTCTGGPIRVRLAVNGRTLVDVTDGRRAPGFQSIYLFAASYETAPIEVAFDNVVFTRG